MKILLDECIDRRVAKDINLFFQQNLPQFNLAVIILQVSTNRLRDLQPQLPKLLTVLPVVPKGQVHWVNL